MGGRPCHLLSDGLKELNLDDQLTLVLLEFLHFLLLRSNQLLDRLDLPLEGPVLETLLDELTDENLLLLMQVPLGVLVLLVLRQKFVGKFDDSAVHRLKLQNL